MKMVVDSVAAIELLSYRWIPGFFSVYNVIFFLEGELSIVLNVVYILAFFCLLSDCPLQNLHKFTQPSPVDRHKGMKSQHWA